MMKWSAVLVLLLLQRVPAQQVPVLRLGAPDGSLTEWLAKRSMNQTLDSPRDINELRDGTLLIMDGLRVIAGDFRTGKVSVLADLPAGTLVALPADTSIILTPQGWYFAHRLTQIGMLSPRNPVVSALSSDDARIEGADDAGFVLAHYSAGRQGDSSVVVRINRRSGQRDTIARLWAGRPAQPGVFRPVCQEFERATSTADGWIAVARVNPYRVDWRSPTGQWTHGRAIPVPRTPMTERDKSVYRNWRATERTPQPRDTILSWPATVCPWIGGYRPIPTPEGRVAVYRVPTSDAPATRYDVVNRKGEVDYQLAMSPDEAIIGFGRNSVYIARSEGRWQTIHRYRWPLDSATKR